MSQRLIPLNVDDEHIRGGGVNVGAAGSHDAVVLELSFSEMWRDLTKKILWIDSLGTGSTETIVTADMAVDEDTYQVPIPSVPLSHPGKMSMTIIGVFITGEGDDAIETVRIVTEAAFFRVMESFADAYSLSDITPTLAEQLQAEIDTILQTILDAKTSEQQAQAWATGQIDGTDVDSDAPQYHNNAKYYAEEAGSSATSAAAEVENAEAWATGTRDGSPVTSEDATYHNNSKYYSEQSSDSATSASGSATLATNKAILSESWAVGGTGTRTGEDTNNAKYWAEEAQQAAGGGVTSFNGRNGTVLPQSGDYTPDLVGAIPKAAGSTVPFSIGCDENGIFIVTPDEDDDD